MSSAKPIEWRLLDHCCSVCFGRLLSRPGRDGATWYQCSNCGLSRESTRPETLCACGITLKTGKNAGLRCVKQANPTPECPSEVIVEEVRGKP